MLHITRITHHAVTCRVCSGMWTVSGPFDGQVTGDVAFSSAFAFPSSVFCSHHHEVEVKLFKTGKRYALGRKEGASPLVVNNKRISKSHGEFAVAEFGHQNVVSHFYPFSNLLLSRAKFDPNAQPKLEYWNAKEDRTILLHRAGDPANVASINPGATEELGDGDVVFIANSLPLTCVSHFLSFINDSRFICSIRWERLCVCIGKESIDLAACAELGVSLSYSLHDSYAIISNRHQCNPHACRRNHPPPTIFLCFDFRYMRLLAFTCFFRKEGLVGRCSPLG
jgi:hypothetical protein